MIPRNTATQIIFMPVPRRNPANAPVADFKEPVRVLPEIVTSPIKAPANGPIRTSGGKAEPKIRPIIRPIVAPQTAALLPPKFFVSQGCRTKSRIVIIRATTKVMMMVTQEVFVKRHQCPRSIPIQATGGPGIPGTIDPTNPIRNKAKIMIKRGISKNVIQ